MAKEKNEKKRLSDMPAVVRFQLKFKVKVDMVPCRI